MATPVQQNLQSSNSKYAASFTHGSLALPPAKKYLVVTCMDARIDPVAAYGIPLGDAHIVRNAGGSAVEALRSIIVSEQLLGTKEVLIIKHTGCGMLTFKNEDAYGVVEKNLGSEARREVAEMDLLPFGDLEKSVTNDVDFLKSKKAIPADIVITGWIYDVETGKVRQVI